MANRNLRIFDGKKIAGSDSMKRRKTSYPPGYEDEAALVTRGAWSGVLFQGDQPGDFSVLALDLAPNAVIVHHFHDTDCLYLVTEGEITLGARLVKKGGGFFVGANQRYGYQAGAEGARVVEVRSDTMYSTTITESNVERVVGIARANVEAWDAYFDDALRASTAP